MMPGRPSRASEALATASGPETLLRWWEPAVGKRSRISLDRAGDRAPKHDREVLVELGACILGEVVALAGPGDWVGEGADPDGERRSRFGPPHA